MTKTTKKAIHYTCVGAVCGGCDIEHRTAAGAGQCCRQHHRDVVLGHGGRGYPSDRTVCAVEGGVLRRLTDDEWFCAAQDHEGAC